jgi:hypothetical protein
MRSLTEQQADAGWTACANELPPIGVVVETKIDDADGCRNEQQLKRGGNGRLWFYPDGSMYVYYTPTHWRPSSDSAPVVEIPKGEIPY